MRRDKSKIYIQKVPNPNVKKKQNSKAETTTITIEEQLNVLANVIVDIFISTQKYKAHEKS